MKGYAEHEVRFERDQQLSYSRRREVWDAVLYGLDLDQDEWVELGRLRASQRLADQLAAGGSYDLKEGERLEAELLRKAGSFVRNSAAPPQWLRRYLAPLAGGRIVSVGVTEEGFPQLIVEKKPRGKPVERYVLEVSQDMEGNGPGFIFGLPNPK